MGRPAELGTLKLSHAKTIYCLCRRINEAHLAGVIDLTDHNSAEKLAAAEKALSELSFETATDEQAGAGL